MTNNTIVHTSATSAQQTFAEIGIQGKILDIINRRSISTPTPIQHQAIPLVTQGKDLIGIAQTGTGKTLAFVLPILQHMSRGASTGDRMLVLVPTRELAYQVDEVCRWFTSTLRLYSEVIVGGASMYKQISGLKRKPQIIIATPGRLIDHLKQRTVELSRVKYLVLDEADRMFDMGFAPQIQQILKQLPAAQQRQTVLFSATMPDAIALVVKQYMNAPVRVEIAVTGTTAKDVQQEMIIIDKLHHREALLAVLKEYKNESVLIFSRTKHQAKKLTQLIRAEGYKAEELHSNLSLAQRTRAVAAMQSRRSQILIATDIAARGIDIAHLGLVINFDLPTNPEDYIHRIGRTGRAGRVGRAISFVISDQGQELRRIQRLIDVQIQQVHLPQVPSAQLTHSAQPQSYGRRGGYRGGGRRTGGARRGSGGGQRSGGHRSGGYRSGRR